MPDPEYDPTFVPLTFAGVGVPPPEHVIALSICAPVYVAEEVLMDAI